MSIDVFVSEVQTCKRTWSHNVKWWYILISIMKVTCEFNYQFSDTSVLLSAGLRKPET